MDARKMLIWFVFMLGAAFCEITEKQYALMPTLFEFDDYEKCMSYGDEALYCRVSFQLRPEDEANPNEIWKVIEEVSSSRRNYRHDLLRHGVCVTTLQNVTSGLSADDRRLPEELNRHFNQKYRPMGLKGEVVSVKCETTKSKYQITFYDISFVTIVTTYVVFVVFASLYEGFARYRPPEKYLEMTGSPFGKFISCFSIPRNWERLTTVNWDDPDVQSFRCVQGLRFFNTLCVINLHVAMATLSLPAANPRYVETLFDYAMFKALYDGGHGVQLSIMLSSWMFSYNFFLMFKDKKEIKFRHLVMIFFHRLFRLLPLLLVVVGFNSTWLAHMGRGPFWDLIVGDEYRNCRRQGWTTILQVNTFVLPYGMCMPESWYMAVDTQFFAILLLLLWWVWNQPKRLPLIFVTWMAVHLAVAFTFMYRNEDYKAVFEVTPETLYDGRSVKIPQWMDLGLSVVGNMPGPVCGLVLGYICFRYKNQRFAFFSNKVITAVWWSVLLFLVFGDVYYPTSQVFAKVEASRNFNIFFGTAGRFIICVMLIPTLWSLSLRTGWIVNYIFEWRPTYVLGRITYGAYLIHMMFIRVMLGIRSQPYYWRDYFLICDSLAICVIAYIVGTVAALLFELPVSQLQKYLTVSSKRIVNYIFEWRPTYVLGRITYGAYLIHMMFIRVMLGIRSQPYYWRDYFLICDSLAICVIAYIVGTVAALLFELPVSQLQKYLTVSSKSKPKEVTADTKAKVQ